MDSYEATRVVFSRIQSFDPENASKIMGLLLIQDHGEKEMIRLAFGPETLVHSVILKARKDLGLSSSNSPSSTPSSPSPFCSSNPIAISRQNSFSNTNSTTTSRLSLTITNPSHEPLSNNIIQQQSSPEDNNSLFLSSNPSSSSTNSSNSLSSSSLPFYQNGSYTNGHNNNNNMDEFHLQEQLSFLNENSSPTLGPNNPDLYFTQQDHLLLSSSPTSDMFSSSNYWPSSPSIAHRRSCSVSDMCLAADDPNSGFGWKPCLYYARGYCKNGTTCRFLHGDDSLVLPQSHQQQQQVVSVGSPSNKLDNMIDHHHHHHHHQCHHNQNQHTHHELLRSKSVQQQRLVSASSHQLMANSFPYSPKCMNFLLQQQQQNESQRAVATGLMMGSEELHKFGRSSTRLERNEFAMNGVVNPASRQIYLTFPADSTFREEDVSNYFSIYGPVQDVRIPYQQKRMFGFVTFVYPETVKLILAKGNPHFVCDARVLVKPYKEKGKVQDKYRKQQQEQGGRGDFSPCGTPTGLESRDPFDLQLGARMFYNSQDMLWRRKLEEQAEFQQALELQSRRLMGLQLLDVKKQHHRTLSTGSPIHSPTQSPNFFGQNIIPTPIHTSSEVPLDQGCSSPPITKSSATLDPSTVTVAANGKESPTRSHGENGNDKESSHDEIGDLLESLEHNLPDSPFASPTKAGEPNYDHMNAFSGHNVVVGSNEANNDHSYLSSSITTSLLPSSTLDITSFKSFNCQLPRFTSGHGAIGMYGAPTGGPKCPVGI